MNTIETTPKRPAFDFTSLMARAMEVLREPTTIWAKVKDEPTTVKDLFIGYIMPLAAIGPICDWLGMMIFGIKLPLGITYRIGFFPGLVQAILVYVVTLAAIFALAQIIPKIAAKFDGAISVENSLKWLAYSMTPGFLGAALQIVPALGIIGALAGIYGLYILINGITPMTGVPESKKWPFFGLCAVAAIVIGFVLAAILGMFSITGTGVPGDGQLDLGPMGDTLKRLEQSLPKQ